MATKQKRARFTSEIADLLSRGASPEEILHFHPSAAAKARAKELLDKLKGDQLTRDEEWELGEFEYAEMLMQLAKARIRSRSARSA
jgi:hypothetical protein